MHVTRYLVVTADDFGIGPATSRGILDLASRGLVTGTVLLVNSPYAMQAIDAWRRAGEVPELGWHPCLTLDRPVAPVDRVPSLVGEDGCFRRLGAFARSLALGRINPRHIAIELKAQYECYRELVGRPPTLVNSHHHVQIFPPVGKILRQLLAGQFPLPYLRRVREPWQTLARVPGARGKRAFLSALGRWDARAQRRQDFPGNEWLAGVTDPPHVANPDFLTRWLSRMPGRVVELTCHPGYLDATLIGRDCTPDDGHVQRRSHELQLLQLQSFRIACHRAGFQLVSPAQLLRDLRDSASLQAA